MSLSTHKNIMFNVRAYAAENVEETIPLIESGYIEATDFNGVNIFKIPKSRLERAR
jgi:hypothetical protein